jgi:hypothetical protein
LPSEPARPPLPRAGNLTPRRGDRSSRRALVGNGDATDLREWASHPFLVLRAGFAGIAIHCERLRHRRLLWNPMRPFFLECLVGFARLRSCPAAACTDRSRRIGIAEHMDPFPHQPAEAEHASMRKAGQAGSALQSWNRAADKFLALLGEAPITAGVAP